MNESDSNYISVINHIHRNICHFQHLLNEELITYTEKFDEMQLKKVIDKLKSSYRILPTRTSQYLLYASSDYMIKVFYLYPELKKIQKQLKGDPKKEGLRKELKAFLRCPKNEKNAILLNGKQAVFNSVKCLNIEDTFMMFIYDNKGSLFSRYQSLRSFIQSDQRLLHGRMTEEEIWPIAVKLYDFLEAMSGFEYLVHGNLTIDNIFISRNNAEGENKGEWEIKVTDFNCSRYLTKRDRVYSKQPLPQFVNERYQSPEYYQPQKAISRKNATKCDLYSFGLILFYLATGKELFEGIEHQKSNDDKALFIQSSIEKAKGILIDKGKGKAFSKMVLELLPKSCENSKSYERIEEWIKGTKTVEHLKKELTTPLFLIEELLPQPMLHQKRERDDNIKTEQ